MFLDLHLAQRCLDSANLMDTTRLENYIAGWRFRIVPAAAPDVLPGLFRP